MGRMLAKTIALYDEGTGKAVTYLAGTELPDEVDASSITNPSVFADEVEDTSAADAAAEARARDAYDAGRPLRVLGEDELHAWAYEPDSEAGKAAEVKLVAAEGGTADPDGAAGLSDPAGDDADDADDDVIDFSDEPPREGRGSGVTAWRTYAEGKGLEVPADADVDGIRALVDARKAAQAAE
jgi:hypothetical protein